MLIHMGRHLWHWQEYCRRCSRKKTRLTRELNAVVKMIKAAGRGAQAAVQEYSDRVSDTTKRNGRRRRGRPARVGVSALTVPKRRRKMSAAARKRIAAAQKARWAKMKDATGTTK